ncbi:MAG: archaemetzincin family Zn-dependent metalloprotease [Ignavibacteria bacterium]|jgi:archaemetzincin|nr:archaemetzincin family Zn-dependent metalloprotease [Ignavibacteria bacterium]MCU7504249.1 archaemetzincin family Zn-dependent metalloprotease [Ignavibacteria bacterium]MCU7516094.1 archaemetzincin family Zn-dependent metalloprotease [Ignavibacteria bacterium]
MKFFIAPIEFSNVSVLNSITKDISVIFKDNVSLISLPLNTAAAYSRDRGQYFSTQLIADAMKLTPAYDGKVLMLVEFDLFVPVFTYVFGEAQLNGKHSIVSLCRLHEEFYSGKTNDKLLHERSLKEILHELGHNMGLIHCRNWNCVMHSSQGVEEIDIKGNFYCPECSGILSNNGYKDTFVKLTPDNDSLSKIIDSDHIT